MTERRFRLESVLHLPGGETVTLDISVSAVPGEDCVDALVRCANSCFKDEIAKRGLSS